MKHVHRVLILLTVLCLLLTCIGCDGNEASNTDITEPTVSVSPTTTTALPSSQETETIVTTQATASTDAVLDAAYVIPPYDNDVFAVINDNEPFFTEADITDESYEFYSPLDEWGRCGVAVACIGQDLMPTEGRESISSVKPSGWHNESYDFVDGGYVYNRCHLIGFQLAGENANERNLITGTRYFNVDGMLPFENMVADYVKETDHHVMFRVTPYYEEENLVADGVLMEAYSVEDHGEGVCFNVFVYNVQPGVVIDYATGYNHAADAFVSTSISTVVTTVTNAPVVSDVTYVLNTNTKKIHIPSCYHVKKISVSNYQETTDSLDTLQSQGYVCCKTCF